MNEPGMTAEFLALRLGVEQVISNLPDLLDKTVAQYFDFGGDRKYDPETDAVKLKEVLARHLGKSIHELLDEATQTGETSDDFETLAEVRFVDGTNHIETLFHIYSAAKKH